MKLSDIPQRLRVLGRSQADLARHLDNLDPSTLTKMIKGARRVQAHEVVKLEAFFGEKLELDGVSPEEASFKPRRLTQRRIPVYGYAAAGGEDLIAYADDQVLEWREPPPLWSGNGLLAYVRLTGASMEPRYFAGEVAPVLLGVQPGRGQDTLIEFVNGTATIKTYLGRRSDTVQAHQYNPDRDVSYALRDIRAMHAVWRPGLL